MRGGRPSHAFGTTRAFLQVATSGPPLQPSLLQDMARIETINSNGNSIYVCVDFACFMFVCVNIIINMSKNVYEVKSCTENG